MNQPTSRLTDSTCPDTIAVRAGIESDTQFGAVIPPLYLSSNYSFEDLNQPRKYDYSRSGNPTRDILAESLAKLEKGAGGVITATGMSAILLVLQCLNPGDLVVAPHDCYGGTYRLFTSLAEKGQFKVKFVDQGDAKAINQVLLQKPKMLWIETPSNPLLRVVDISELCQKFGEQVIKVVDNTFLPPIQQTPICLGADLVVHSTTKYINGHSDIVGGAVIAKTPELYEKMSWWANCLGITASPFDSFLTTRGLRTLDVRIKQHLENTKIVVDFLQNHAAVEKIYYPGLITDVNYQIAKKQQQGFGAMISFELKGDMTNVKQLVNNLSIFTLAESLGGVESLICHPATMTHAAVPIEDQIKAGINSQLLRLSIGIENHQDLIADLDIALNRSQLSLINTDIGSGNLEDVDKQRQGENYV